MSKATPYSFAKAITISDTVDFGVAGSNQQTPALCDSIYCGGAGIVQVVFQDGSVVAFTVVAGETLYLRARRVNATNTTASLMVAQYYL